MTTSLSCLDCDTGGSNRVYRKPSGYAKRVKTGRLTDYNPLSRDGAVWVRVKDQIEEFRTAVLPVVHTLIPRKTPPSAA